MSRVAKQPITIPAGVEARIDGQVVIIKGPKGSLQQTVPGAVQIVQEDKVLKCVPRSGDDRSRMMAGTARALLSNMVTGVTQTYSRKLELVGVGYRAQMQGRSLNLTLGFSHPVVFPVPEGITIETPSQTEIMVRGVDKQRVGQVAANIRAFRPPEPYKGKGVRYSNEVVVRKEAKKK
jgi:large subunit ribosomal protein L6